MQPIHAGTIEPAILKWTIASPLLAIMIAIHAVYTIMYNYTDTHIGRPYAYGAMLCPIRVRDTPYAYGPTYAYRAEHRSY